MSRFISLSIALLTMLLYRTTNLSAADAVPDVGGRIEDPFSYVEQLAAHVVAHGELATATPLIPTSTSIEMFKRKVHNSPEDFRCRTILGQLYLRSAKETDNLAAFEKAENVLREALKQASNYQPARIHLAIALQARHQFQESLELANEYLEAKPGDALGLATLGDAQIELGQYEAAARTYSELKGKSNGPPVLARSAHLEELLGNSNAALAQLKQAVKLMEDSGALESNQSWYQMRLGHQYFSMGELEQAEACYRKSMTLEPDYAPAMSGLVMVLAGQAQMDEAQQLALRAVELHGEPPMMAQLGDLLTLAGRMTESMAWYDKAANAMAEEAKVAAAAHYRERALFLLDHDRELELAMELAEQDLAARPSIESEDAMAWALYRNGKPEAALRHIRLALRLGTRNALMHYHAGKIHEALGHSDEAMSQFELALEINAAFSILGSSDAKTALASLSNP